MAFVFFIGRKIARRNVLTRATEVEAPVTAEAETTELPEIVKTAQEAVKRLLLLPLNDSAMK